MMYRLVIFLISALVTFTGFCQYAPAAGEPGSTAIHADSSVFIGWATACIVTRGPIDISQPANGNADYGMDADVIGKADGVIVSLGDGGEALITFETPVMNGPGPDFAVFENSLWADFLELCFVEVSSDGINFYRFPSVSLTQTNTQVGSFGSLQATDLYNLGGKYEAMYGTPFDLEELTNTTGLDVNNITHVKLIDVIGNIEPGYATYDSEGNAVNDPWPTDFGSCGFDLDAIGVIHSSANFIRKSDVNVSIYPQPANSKLFIECLEHNLAKVEIYCLSGILQKAIMVDHKTAEIDVSKLSSGLYLVQLHTNSGIKTKRIIIE